MKLIQVYYTGHGQKYNAGFTDRFDMLAYLTKSISIHSKIFESVIIYTDVEGSDFLIKNGISETNIKIFEFEHIDGRFTNLCKLQVHLDQTEPYIMCDIDAIIFDKPNWDDAMILTELKRSNTVFTVYSYLGLKPVHELICSGIIGFKDMKFVKEYANRAIEHIRNWELPFVNYECLWSVEELLLTNMVLEDNITVYTLNPDSYNHLQGG